VALDRLLDLLAHRFLVLVLCFFVLVIPVCGRQSWPALVNFTAHNYIVFDLI